MRILLYGLNYPPDLIGVAKYTGEMAVWLAAQGDSVRVVTAPPYYPEGRVKGGYSAWRFRRETLEGVPVLRCPLWVRPALEGARRVFHLLSFALTSVVPLLAISLFWRPDAIVVFVPTLLSGPAGALAARLSGAACWIHVQDLEIDAAFRLGQIRSARLKRFAGTLERAVLRRFDVISSISEAMCTILRRKIGTPQPVIFFPNWVDLQTIRPLAHPSRFRAELGLAEDDVVVLYAGNMGGKQGLETVIEAARRLAGTPGLSFILAGNGSVRPALEAAAADLPTVRFLPLQPADRFNDLLNLADIHLMPERPDAAELFMPSKLTGMMASGRPVIAGALPDTELYRVVGACGRVVAPADSAALAEAILSLSASSEERRRLGEQARKLAAELWDKQDVLGRFRGTLAGLVAARNKQVAAV